MKKIHARQLILKNIHALAYKKFIQEFDDEKKSCVSKIPLPLSPITSFLMVCPLEELSYKISC